MNLVFEHLERRYQGRLDEAVSIAIDLEFAGPQPTYFGAPQAKRSPLSMGVFTGRTQSGSSCNLDVIEMVPHCNGTHTETIGHIVSDEVWIGQSVVRPCMLAALVSVQPRLVSELVSEVSDTYRPALDDSDQVISASIIEAAVAPLAAVRPDALIIRTMPNHATKRSRAYSIDDPPAFLTVEAMEMINNWSVQHLLVDLPSVDRLNDEGRLTNHHLYWNVKEETHQILHESHRNKTITEMVFVDSEIQDGLYGLNLQFPAFYSDAAPSRPIIWPVVETS